MPTFNTPNSQHSYTVPSGAIALAITLIGGSGGDGSDGDDRNGDVGGAGGKVMATVPSPTPGSDLTVVVGEDGGDAVQNSAEDTPGAGGQSPLGDAGDGGGVNGNHPIGAGGGGGSVSAVVRASDGTELAAAGGGGGGGGGAWSSLTGGGGGGGSRGGVGGTSSNGSDGQDGAGSGLGGDGGDANADGGFPGSSGGATAHSSLTDISTSASTAGPEVTIVPHYPPAAPQTLQETDVRETEVDIIWTDDDSAPATDPEDGFKVYTSRDGGSTWTEVADLAADAESYTITGLLHGEQYWIQVEAYNAYGRAGAPMLLVADGNSVTETSPTQTRWQTQIEGEYITES